MTYRITILPQEKTIEAPAGSNLLTVLRDAGHAPDAPCGGMGTCGKCTVFIDGQPLRACTVPVDRDMTITLSDRAEAQILTAGIAVAAPVAAGGHRIAVDIGTTTVVAVLLAPDGRELAVESARNPQAPYGADVVSRIRAAMDGSMEALTAVIRTCLNEMTQNLCARAGISPEAATLVSVVGNPAMQQLFLGISLENLAHPPFSPVLTQAEAVDAGTYLPGLKNAKLIIVPDISGFVGADTLGCMLALELDRREEMTLLVDIGTNGEMVLGNRNRRISCSTAAGPALEGANIQCGMGAQAGAIDHVWIENGKLAYRVICGGEAEGICGSGIIDTAAAALELGLLNSRGKILNKAQRIVLTDRVFLTQEDIRQVQLAKGAIAAGIQLLAQRMDISLEDIHRVFLAGAFGTYMDPASACRMGLLPPALSGRIEAVGNAALSGAKLLTADSDTMDRCQRLAEQTQDLNLSQTPEFPHTFAKCMRFDAGPGGTI